MHNRKMLYGYKMEHGDVVLHKEEEPIVHRVFNGYLTGMSYKRLADSLKADGIPFCQEAPGWNKHKVKRMLENPRYTGEDGYPPIIDIDTFQKVQRMITDKSAGQVSRKSELDALWPKLRSGCCHSRLLRIGGAAKATGALRMRCETCGAVVTTQTEELLAQTARQLAAHDRPESKPYAPSAEAIHLANAINRALEQPANGMDAVALILRGASARYNCCEGGPAPDDPASCPDRIDWARFRQAVSHIIIAQDNTVTIHF